MLRIARIAIYGYITFFILGFLMHFSLSGKQYAIVSGAKFGFLGIASFVASYLAIRVLWNFYIQLLSMKGE